MALTTTNTATDGAPSSNPGSTTNPKSQTLDVDVQQQLQSITSRTHNDNSLEALYGETNPKLELDGTTDGNEAQMFQPPSDQNLSIPDQAKFSSNLTFTPELNLKTNPVTRCNTINNDNLSRCLSNAYLVFEGNTTTQIDESKRKATFNTALAWHIAEYRPTAVTHGKILDVDAQTVYDALVNKDRGITIRRIARAWSPAISNVLHSYASLNPPVFTTQCNDTFADPHTRIAVAPFFFDGVDPGTIPVNLSRLVATGLAYSKRQATNSPYSLHKRPAFVTQKEEDLNLALQFTG